MANEQKIEFMVQKLADGTIDEGITPATSKVLGSIVMDRQSVRDRLDEYLRDVAKMRFDDLGGDAIIKSIMERRVEVAVAAASRLLDNEIANMARTMAAERVRKMVADMPMEVTVTVKVGT